MGKIYFSGLNHEATIADLLSATEDEFSAILSKIKAEYKKLHGIKTMKRSVKPYKYVLQKIRKVYYDYVDMGAYTMTDMDNLITSVWSLFGLELGNMGYTQEQFKLDFANEVATIMSSTIFQKSYVSSLTDGLLLKMVQEYKAKYPERDLQLILKRNLTKQNIASWAVFQGTVYKKSPYTGKKIGNCYAKICMTEGFDGILTDDILKFKTFWEMDELIAKSSVVGRLFQQSFLAKGKGIDIDALFKVPSTKSTSKKVENKAENEGVE